MTLTPEMKARLLAMTKGNGGSNVAAPTANVAANGPNAVEGPAEQNADKLSGATVSDKISPAPLSNSEQIVGRISELKNALTNNLPGYEKLLQTIHTALTKDDTAVWQLTEEQVGVIVSGLSKKKNIVIATAAAKSQSTSKKLKSIGVDDL